MHTVADVPTAATLAGVGVVSQHNCPLYLHPCREADELALHSAILASLDTVNERVDAPMRSQQDMRNLGCVLETGDLRVHAYAANTRVKLLAVVRGEARPEDVGRLLRSLHDLYTRAVCDPFYELESPITSRRFAHGVSEAIRTCALQAG
eukprot:TRINITY_DN13087_c0_g1_i2.p1 TRINITY_DN13087_c0_g1~~TRINITY_DN13087_c0_g1_i2.p1  ORF type:complete len:150 (+),score=37.46 TRINITY_DN13087_c0_g1_i2:82-531(+)